MPGIQVFDKPLCCSSGVCGPDVDPALVTLLGRPSVVGTARRRSAANQSRTPAEPVRSERACARRVEKAWQRLPARGCGERCGGESGRLPNRTQLAGWTGITLGSLPELPVMKTGCCGDTEGTARFIVLVLLTCSRSEVENASPGTADTTTVFHRQGRGRQDIPGVCHGGCTRRRGRNVLLVSTDPASNLGQVFGVTIGEHDPTAIPGVPAYTL